MFFDSQLNQSEVKGKDTKGKEKKKRVSMRTRVALGKVDVLEVAVPAPMVCFPCL